MSYKIEDVNGCTKKIAFSFDNLDLTNEIAEAIKKKRKDVAIKGFRKGKAPMDMVQNLYGPQIETDALNRFVQNKLYDVISEEDLRVVGYPTFDNMEYKPGESVSFDAMVEIFPTFELQDMSGLSFKEDAVVVDEEEVNKARENLLASKSEIVEIGDENTVLEKGHFAVMDFQGVKEDGDRPENMKGKEFILEIGSGQFIPGFEDGMMGMKREEKKDIELTFPEDYQADDLQNAKVVFEVKLLEIKEKKFPEFTDELAKELGHESVDDFDKKGREGLQYQKERQVKEKLHQEILEKLVEDNPFELPATLIVQQETYLKDDMKKNLEQQGFNEEMVVEYFEKWKEDLTAKAEFQVRSGLILDKLSKTYEIETTDADLDQKIEETAKQSGMDIDQVRNYYTQDERIKKNLMYAIREEKTFAKLTESLTILES